MCPDCVLTKGEKVEVEPRWHAGHSGTLPISKNTPVQDAGHIGALHISTGDDIECFYNIYIPGEVLLHRHSTAFVINVMLWPTLIFTTGFCCLVFACLFVQKDECLPQYTLPCSSSRTRLN